MKAIVYDRYGSADQMRLEVIDRPTPGPGEILVRVVASAVNSWDWHLLHGMFFERLMFGTFRPLHRLLGSEIAGSCGGGRTWCDRVQPWRRSLRRPQYQWLGRLSPSMPSVERIRWRTSRPVSASSTPRRCRRAVCWRCTACASDGPIAPATAC